MGTLLKDPIRFFENDVILMSNSSKMCTILKIFLKNLNKIRLKKILGDSFK